jgi:hypothetical protein
MEKTQLEGRGFKRFKFEEKSIVQFDIYTIEVKLLDLSPKGALIDFGNAVSFLKMNDKMILSFRPGNSVAILQFEGEVVYIRDNLARIVFLPIGGCSN